MAFPPPPFEITVPVSRFIFDRLQIRNSIRMHWCVCTLFQLKTSLVSCQRCHFHVFMWWLSTAAYFETEVIINLPTSEHCKHISISNEIRPRLKNPHYIFNSFLPCTVAGLNFLHAIPLWMMTEEVLFLAGSLSRTRRWDSSSFSETRSWRRKEMEIRLTCIILWPAYDPYFMMCLPIARSY